MKIRPPYIEHMSPAELVTADQLQALRIPDKRTELVKGRLVVREPAGHRHGEVAASLTRILGTFVYARGLGSVVAAEPGSSWPPIRTPCGRRTLGSFSANVFPLPRRPVLRRSLRTSRWKSSHPTIGWGRSWRRSRIGSARDAESCGWWIRFTARRGSIGRTAVNLCSPRTMRWTGRTCCRGSHAGWPKSFRSYPAHDLEAALERWRQGVR